MQSVDNVRGGVNCGVEAEGDVRAVDVVVYGLGEAYDIEPLLGQQICCLVGAVAPEGQQAVQLQVLVGVLHLLYPVDVVLPDGGDHLEGLALCAEDSAPLGEYPRKLRGLHLTGDVVYKPVIAVLYADDLHIVPELVVARPCNASDSGIEPRAVAP